MHDPFDVIIIGAGLAGLSAGAHLAARGVAPLLIEADRLWAGGRLSGGEPEILHHNGQTWQFKPDHGVHAVWGGYDNLRALLAHFTDTRLIPSGGEEWINRWGREVRALEAGNAVRARWLPAPFHYLNLLFHPQIWANITPLDFLSLPGYLVSVMLATGLDPLAEKRALDGLHMNEFFRGWTPNLKATFRGLGANLLAAPEDDISLAGYIAALRFYTMLRRDAWQMAYFPADSHTALIQPLMQSIVDNGGSVQQGITATRLTRTPDGMWRVHVDDSNRQGSGTFYTRHIVLALNAPSAQRLLQNSPPTADQAQQMIFPRGLRNAVVRLWFDAAPREGTSGGMFTGDFLPDNFFWLHRLYDDYAAWADATGGSCLEMHFYDDQTIDTPDENLIVLATTDAQRAFPRLRGALIHATVRRNSKVHTAFRVPDERTLHVKTPWDGIAACGDWVGYASPSFWMERAATTGAAAANLILSEYDLPPYDIHQPATPELSARLLGGVVRGGRRLFSPLFRFRRRS